MADEQEEDGVRRVAFRGVAIYSTDEEEFIAAVAAFRAKHKRVPSLVEGFRIALSLGWRKDGTVEGDPR